MADDSERNQSEIPDVDVASRRFGAGLTEANVRRLQDILRDELGLDLPLPETWSRAIALISLVEMLLQPNGVLASDDDQSTGFALPRS